MWKVGRNRRKLAFWNGFGLCAISRSLLRQLVLVGLTLGLLAADGMVVLAQVELPPGTDIAEVRGYYKREHSLVKPYQGSGMDIPYWDIVGSTMVSPSYIRLTPDDKSRQGALWNRVPVYSRDWELMVTFGVHGSTGDLFGDGMAVWYMKDRSQLGAVFGSKDYFTGLGIFLDTYSNHNGPHKHSHPYITAMVNNGSAHYDHDRDGTHTQLGGEETGCEAKFRNKDYDTNLLVRYTADTLSIYTDIQNTRKWELCLSVPGVRLPTGYFLGFSAATGDLSDNHDVMAVKLYELDVMRASEDVDRSKIAPEASVFAAPRDHVTDPAPSKLGVLKTFFLVVIAIVGVVVFLGIGVVLIQKRQESSRKRFY